MAELLEQLEDLVRDLVEQRRWSHSRVSDYLQQTYPGTRGLSLRSIQRFCSAKGIHRTSRLDDTQVDEVVSEAVNMVGPVYGRKTMTGFLRSQGIVTSETRVGSSLQRINVGYHHARRTATARQLNPIPYSADYFGHKVHIDQNEKLVMFGVTHICAVDGYSGKIVGFITMPIKNCIEIFSHLYRPMIQEYGLWDQIRVDHGREWHLMLFVQEQLAHLRYNTDRAPHLQTTSKLNHCVERLWVEVNSRVNYPIKTCLITLQERGEINMDDDHIKFYVSWFTIRVTNIGTAITVSSWNEHRIPGRGIPNERMQENNHVMPVDPSVIPDQDNAVQQMESMGSHLTRFSPFGFDPLESHNDLIRQREDMFFEKFPSYNKYILVTAT
jgi:hypothetical protein